MSVHGIQNTFARPPASLGGTSAVRPGAEMVRAEPQRPAWPAVEPRDARAVAPQPPATSPQAPPPGMDPELWSVLTAEERALVGRLGALGPLTYGRGTQLVPQAPVTRGGRVDVRV